MKEDEDDCLEIVDKNDCAGGTISQLYIQIFSKVSVTYSIYCMFLLEKLF